LEPENQHDPNAVRVELDGETVGHLRRDVARSVGPAFDACGIERAVVAGIIRGGFADRALFGIALSRDPLARRAQLAAGA
jgi:hypothetical protein